MKLSIKLLTIFYFLVYPCFGLKSEETLSPLRLTELKGEALLEAHDYQGAIETYEQLLTPPLPSWQKGRVLYNIGVIHLSQQQPEEALNIFQKIDPTTLFLPNFGRDLLINE